MESAKLHGQVISHYAEHHEHEWKRLSKGKAILEFITTVHYLERYLPGRGDTNGDSEKSISENIKRNEI